MLVLLHINTFRKIFTFCICGFEKWENFYFENQKLTGVHGVRIRRGYNFEKIVNEIFNQFCVE